MVLESVRFNQLQKMIPTRSGKKPRSFLKPIGILGMVFVVYASGIYFRTYSFRWISPKSAREMAHSLVYNKIKEQFKQYLDARAGFLDEAEKWKLAEEKTKETIQSEKNKFEETVLQTARNIQNQKPLGQSRFYLLESDPYYYYYLTREIQRKGNIATQFKAGRYFTPFRQAPKGSWSTMTLHPYLGFWWYRFFHFLKPGRDLMEVLCYFPLVLVLCITFAFFFICDVLKTKPFESFLGSFLLVLAPIFIERSSFGWFDTDPYQYLFPIVILAIFFWGAERDHKRWLFGAIAGLITGLYSLFWAGWPFIFLILAFSGFLVGFVNRLWCVEAPSFLIRYTIVYVVCTLFFAIIFMTPAGFSYAFLNGFSVLPQFAQTGTNLWPNAFLTVGEARPLTIKKLIFETGNYLSFGISILGMAGLFISSVRSRNPAKFLQWFVFLVLFASTLFLALHTERFSILFVLPYSLYAVFGIGVLRRLFERVLQFFFRKTNRPWIARSIAFALLLAVILPPQVILAYAAAANNVQIMNDTWYGALKEIGEKTPESSVIDSWWPPGYFIISIAERRVIADGGSQHFPETYWMAKAYLSDDEREAAGILRMINTSGNAALDYLLKHGFDLPKASRLILNLVKLNRREASQTLPFGLTDETKRKLLDFTHGTGRLTPAYFFVYNDMIEQNLALTLMSNWDFQKAKEIHQEKDKLSQKYFLTMFGFVYDHGLKYFLLTNGFLKAASEKAIYGKSLKHSFVRSENFFRYGADRLLILHQSYKKQISSIFSKKGYLDDVLAIENGIWRYREESPLEKRNGNVLFFQNGLMVNLETMDSFLTPPNSDLKGHPLSLFYMQNIRFEEKLFSGNRVDVSALLIERGGVFTSVLADPRFPVSSVVFPRPWKELHPRSSRA